MDSHSQPRQKPEGREGAPDFRDGPGSLAKLTTQEWESPRQDTQERYHVLATATGQIVWRTRPDGTIDDAPFWCDYTGQSREEAQGWGWLDAIHPADRERASIAWSQALATRRSYETEFRVRRADGVFQSFLVRGAPVLNEDGSLREWVGICTDISERKRIEQENARRLEHAQQARAQAEVTARQLRALQALSDTALAHLSLEDLLPELLDRVRDVMAVDATAILLLSEDGTYLTFRAAHGLDEALATQQRVPLGRGIAGRIAANREPMIVDDLSKIELVSHFLLEKLRSLVGVPLLLGDQVIGVILVGTNQCHRFTGDDTQLLEMIAQRIALAIDHAHLYQAAQQARADAAARACQLEATIEAMTEGVGIYDAQGHSLHTNRAGYAVLGIEANPAHFTSRPHPERIALLQTRDKHGHPFPPERSPLTRALKGEVVSDAESEDMIITALDGPERYLSATAAPTRNAEGHLTGAVFVYRDVTERRRLERRTHDALDALLEMAETLVMVPTENDLAGDGSSPEANHLASHLAEMICRVLGYERTSLITVEPETGQLHPLAVVGYPPKQEQRWRAMQHQHTSLDKDMDRTMAERLISGEVLLLERKFPPLKDMPFPFTRSTMLVAPMRVGKQLIGLLALEHASAEHACTPQEIALAGAVAKLTALVIEREHLLRQREEARANELAQREINRQMDTFLGIASHELNTPLTVLKLQHDILRRRLHGLERQQAHPPPELARFLEALGQQNTHAETQIARLSSLVDDLLNISRIQVNRFEMHLKRVELVAIIQEAVETQSQAHPARCIRWTQPAQEEILVQADADRINQVVMNYLTNALKYVPPDSPIEVRVECIESQVQVEVCDQGPGLTAAQQEHLWERFYRVPGVEVQSGSGVGLGLGLYISKTIIERHGGQVGVESEAGQGATFWFRLPLEA